MGRASDRRLAQMRSFILRTLDDIIRSEIKDPRLGMFCLTDVRLARDLTSAEVSVSALGDPQAVHQTCRVLQAAAPLLWNRLRRQTDLRSVPQLRFTPDLTGQYQEEISKLLSTIPRPADEPEGIAEMEVAGDPDPDEEA